jgi:hypothetical protein
MGLAGFFLIHIKEAGDLKSIPRLAVVGDGNVVVERRCRGWTRVHSLAMIACSTNVVGASTSGKKAIGGAPFWHMRGAYGMRHQCHATSNSLWVAHLNMRHA